MAGIISALNKTYTVRIAQLNQLIAADLGTTVDKLDIRYNVQEGMSSNDPRELQYAKLLDVTVTIK